MYLRSNFFVQPTEMWHKFSGTRKFNSTCESCESLDRRQRLIYSLPKAFDASSSRPYRVLENRGHRFFSAPRSDVETAPLDTRPKICINLRWRRPITSPYDFLGVVRGTARDRFGSMIAGANGNPVNSTQKAISRVR